MVSNWCSFEACKLVDLASLFVAVFHGFGWFYGFDENGEVSVGAVSSEQMVFSAGLQKTTFTGSIYPTMHFQQNYATPAAKH